MRTLAISAVLGLLAGIVSPAQAQAPAPTAPPVAGTDYVEISNGRPLEPAEGKVVVEEFFNYICPACNAFEPFFAAWKARQPAHVKIVHVPASFNPTFVQYARAYYAAQTFNVADKAHAAVYQAIHQAHSIPDERERPNEEKIAAFYASYGVDSQQFLAAMRSFAVDLKVRRANELMMRSRIQSTPSLVVNGRYLVRGSSYQDMLRIADFLIAKEHAAAASGG